MAVVLGAAWLGKSSAAVSAGARCGEPWGLVAGSLCSGCSACHWQAGALGLGKACESWANSNHLVRIPTMKTTPYRFPEQLKFKHLAKHELFIFPAAHGTPAMGPYMKISARRYVGASVNLIGEQIVPNIKAAPVYTIGSINATVSDRVTDNLF